MASIQVPDTFLFPDPFSLSKDALTWLRHGDACTPLPALAVNPWRPWRLEPRVRKRRPKQFPLMQRSRGVLRKALISKGKNA